MLNTSPHSSDSKFMQLGEKKTLYKYLEKKFLKKGILKYIFV